MHIAYVTESFPPQLNALSLIAGSAVYHLRNAGHKVQLIRPRQRLDRALPDGEPSPGRAPAPGTLSDLRLGCWSAASTLRQHWQQRRPQIVHAATTGPLAWAALRAARAEGIATSADLRSPLLPATMPFRLGWLQPLLLRYLRRFHALADCNFVPTLALAEECAWRGFRHLQVTGRSVDPSRFSPAKRDRELRWEWGAGDDDRVLLHVGALAPQRNVGLAMAAFECLRLQSRRLRMVVVGDGPLRDRFETTHPQVRFVGGQRGDALARCYASADVLLLPRPAESLGNVVLEAMASGLVIAAFDTGAAGVLVEHARSGWLAKPGDEAAFFEAARRSLLSADPDGAMRRQARNAALRRDLETQLQVFEQGLSRIVYSSQRRRCVREPALVD